MITEQVFSDKIKLLIMEIIETLLHVLKISIEINELISAIIETINFDSKINLIFSTHINTGGTKLAV